MSSKAEPGPPGDIRIGMLNSEIWVLRKEFEELLFYHITLQIFAIQSSIFFLFFTVIRVTLIPRSILLWKFKDLQCKGKLVTSISHYFEVFCQIHQQNLILTSAHFWPYSDCLSDFSSLHSDVQFWTHPRWKTALRSKRGVQDCENKNREGKSLRVWVVGWCHRENEFGKGPHKVN